jgi:sugar O-acyltransferase (sialic acid O-acetyltransferase NeuD family)
MDQIDVIGGGGHAKMVIEAARSGNQARVVCCLDVRPSVPELLGVPVVEETPEQIRAYCREGVHFFVGIGENRLRQRVMQRIADLGGYFATIVAESAYVSPSAILGEGTVVMPKAVVGAMARVGSGVILNTACSVDHDTRIDDYAHIAPGCHLAGKVDVGEGALLGIGTCVIPGIRIGAWATLGANSTVIREIPDHSTSVGSPARCIRVDKVPTMPSERSPIDKKPRQGR